MKPADFAKMLDYIYANNSWREPYTTCHERHRKAIKYVRANFDSRDGQVWSVTFSQVVSAKKGDYEKTFTLDTPEQVEKVYRWIDEVSE